MKVKNTLTSARCGGSCALGRVGGRIAAAGSASASKFFKRNVEKMLLALVLQVVVCSFEESTMK